MSAVKFAPAGLFVALLYHATMPVCCAVAVVAVDGALPKVGAVIFIATSVICSNHLA